MAGREFMLQPTPAQAIALRRDAALAAERELRKQLPPAPAPSEVSIVRPDLHEDVKRLAKPGPRGRDVNDVFGRLADANVTVGQDSPREESIGELIARTYPHEDPDPQEAVSEVFDWAAYNERLKRDEIGTDAESDTGTAGGQRTAAAD
jgi:hypothetical protein